MNEQNFKHTTAALHTYDLGAVYRRKLWDTVECNEDVYKAEQVEADALRKVQQAYFEDTKTLNSLNSCLRADIDFMRRMCATHKIRANEMLKESIKDRMPIRYAVIKLGYMILGAGRFKEEAIANAEKNHPEAKGKIIEDAESMELADGEIFVASIENDYFDDYFKDFNCFEKIGEDWYFTV